MFRFDLKDLSAPYIEVLNPGPCIDTVHKPGIGFLLGENPSAKFIFPFYRVRDQEMHCRTFRILLYIISSIVRDYTHMQCTLQIFTAYVNIHRNKLTV